MSVRNILAAFLQSRDAYDRVADKLEEKDLNEQERIILGGIRDYYSNDPEARRVDGEILAGSICRGLANPKHHEQFRRVVGELVSADVSPANVALDYIAVRRSAAGERLASAIVSARPAGELRELLSEYNEWLSRTEIDSGAEAAVVSGKSAAALVAERTATATGLIRVAPASLNERLGGGLLRGHHVIVFARPEVGKTLFLVNAACGFARQGLRVLYCGNEDPINDIIMRSLCRLSGRTRAEVIENPDAADTAAREAGYDNLVFAELSPGTPAEIESLAESTSPDVIIVDQLRNLNAKDDNFTRALEKSASAVRNIGKRQSALVISATQAGDSASGKGVLDMGDVDSSNTGIPAQADVLLGIGMSPEDYTRGTRVLSLCKNKPGGNHDYFPVAFDPQRSAVRSMG